MFFLVLTCLGQVHWQAVNWTHSLVWIIIYFFSKTCTSTNNYIKKHQSVKAPLRHTNLWLTDPWFYSSSFLQFISVDGHFRENAMMSVTPSARLWEWARRLGRNPSAFQPSTSENISRWCNIRCVSFSFQAASSCKWPVLGDEGYLEYLKDKLT